MMAPDVTRLAEIRVQGMRVLADVRLRLQGLTVLIGDNGAGKSTLVEAFEILRKVGAGANRIVQEINAQHEGLGALLRLGSPRLSLGATVSTASETFEYDFALARSGAYAIVEQETLVSVTAEHGRQRLLHRTGAECLLGEKPLGGRPLDANLLAAFSLVTNACESFMPVLSAIDVRLPFETRPLWLCNERAWKAPLRGPASPEDVASLKRLGDNLTAAYYTLRMVKGRDEWAETLRLVRLGLGDDIVDVTFPPASGGKVDMALELGGARLLTTATLSDGQLTYLALVAMVRLPTARSVLVFDEPDLHLHPELLMRALDLLEGLSEKHPVVLTTHSDRLLDALSEPETAAVLCRLDETRATELLRPDAKALDAWLKRYRGLGALRAQGAESYVMTRKADA